MAQTQTVTILFCDTVGSTALMSRLGDDANDRVRRRLFVALREAVTANRGTEVKSAGDGIMVAFPASAADAVSCAVAMQRGVARLTAQDPLLGLAIRVGLSSGEASLEDNDWFGVPVVEAARLEHAARPGQILVADVTRTLVGTRGGHTFTRVGALDLKGLPEPLPASEVAWEPDPGLPSVPLPSGLDRGGLPFVGRADALSRLRTDWDAATGGTRQLVLVSGEAGIGKTRLAAEFAAEVHSDHIVVLYGRSESDRDIPYQPFAEALRWYVLAGQPQLLREQVGSNGGDLARIVPALRTRLPDLPEARSGDPRSERQWLFEAVGHTVRALCERAPVLLVLDDLETASAQTLEMLRHLVSSLDPMRLLVLGLAGEAADGTHWAEEAAAFAALPGASSIELQGLGQDEVAALLKQAGVAGDSADFAARVRNETEGNPRFVAELVSRAAETGSAEAVFDAACPYMGLRAFEPGDAELYFGREETVGAFLGRLGANRVLSVVGASGSGKSSLVRAGMVSRLRAGALPGSANWDVVLMTPGANPLAELASRLAALAHLSAPSVLRDLEGEPRTLDLIVRQALADKGDGARVLLVLDQFEELFTLCRDAAERQRFIDGLLHAVSIPGGRTLAIIAMRADFYGESARYPGLADALEASHALLGPMEPEDMREAIERPAAAAGLRIEPGLTDRILRDVGDEPGGLPLLSHALLETWKRREGRNLTIAGYTASGGVRGAIAQTADTVYSGLGENEQTIARNLFVRLTELGEGTEDTRRRVSFAEVVPAGAGGEQVRSVITKLADARLLTTSTDSVEVAHEALIREWPRLRGWLDDDREGLRLMRHLTESALSWERLDRDEGELYRGTRLSAALEWEQRTAPGLNPVERAFLDESREVHERELREAHARARRLRILALAASALAVVALVVGGLAIWQWVDANEERDKAQAATGQAQSATGRAEAAAMDAIFSRLESEIPDLLTRDRSLSFALAAHAYRLQPGARAGQLLNLVLGQEVRFNGSFAASEGQTSWYAVSPDSGYVATRGSTGLIELHDAASPTVLASARVLPTPQGFVFGWTSFTDDSRFLVVLSHEPRVRGEVTVLNVPDLTVKDTFEFPLPTDEEVMVYFASLRGDRLLIPFVSGGRGRAWEMDLRNGSIETMAIPNWGICTPKFSPDGNYLSVTTTAAETLLIDSTTFQVIRSFPGCVTPAPDGTMVTTYEEMVGLPGSETVRAWSVETGELLAEVPRKPSVNGASAGAPESVAVPSVSDIVVRSTADLAQQGRSYFLPNRFFPDVTLSGDGESLYGWNFPLAVQRWDLTGAGLVAAYTEATGPGLSAAAPDGSWLIKVAPDGNWTRWSLPGFEILGSSGQNFGAALIPRNADPSLLPAVSNDGQHFATVHTRCVPPAEANCPGVAVLWETSSGQPVGTPIPLEQVDTGTRLAFHPDRPFFAVAERGSGGRVFEIKGGSFTQVSAFADPDEENNNLSGMYFVPSDASAALRLVTWGNVVRSVWDVNAATGRLLATHGTLWRIHGLMPNGDVFQAPVVDIEFYALAELLDSTEPQPHTTRPLLPGVGGTVFFAATVSADGSLMALRSQTDSSVLLLDLEEEVTIGSTFAAAGPGSTVVYLDREKMVVSSDLETIVWDLDTALWAEKVCSAAGRNLTEAEWTDYFPGQEYEATCEQWPVKPTP